MKQNQLSFSSLSYQNKKKRLRREVFLNEMNQAIPFINAPRSTKNSEKQRDPEMKQTKKGNQWYFGMKARVGSDSKIGIVHTLTTTPAINILSAEKTGSPDRVSKSPYSLSCQRYRAAVFLSEQCMYCWLRLPPTQYTTRSKYSPKSGNSNCE